ncbi:MAG: carbamoyltransferase C-terminal domain-containing protein [Micavibrio sp.]|nr:carbamoyltransferase C-terminal domain-containing protein [Micavibrio sp.]
MYILGVNGWNKRSHDPAVALIKDNELIACIEEERLSRSRHAFEQIPYKSIQYCLGAAGIEANDIDVLAIGWDYHKKYRDRGMAIPPETLDLIELYLPANLFGRTRKPELDIHEHHKAHAASVYHLSNVKEAAVLVLDGQGENESTSFWRGNDNGHLERVASFPIGASLGYFYEAINIVLGFHNLDSGKTMGLAPYGKIITPFEDMPSPEEICPGLGSTNTDEHTEVTTPLLRYFDKKFSVKVTKATLQKEFSQLEKDVAASAQNYLERKYLEYVQRIKVAINLPNLCIAGGVAMNCCANSFIQRARLFENYFHMPLPFDAGVSIGAAAASLQQRRKEKVTLRWSVYSGAEYSDNDIKNAIQEKKLQGVYVSTPETIAADFLSRNKVIAWFQGRMEMGARALGNRSVLADPREESNKIRVNAIKGREQWRPFSPSVLAEDMAEIFDENIQCPYMMHTLNVKNEFKQKIPAVIHCDGTSRAQSVTKESSPLYYALINEFKSRTGIPLILNTSLNGPGEPICCSPADALDFYSRANFDAIFIGNYMIIK